MNKKYLITLILVFQIAGCSVSGEKTKYPPVIKHVDQIDMVLMHCQNPKATGERVTAWPSGEYFAPRYSIESQAPIDSIEKLNAFLDTRPELLKQNHRYIQSYERNGWYIVHVAANEWSTYQAEIAMGIMHAFAVEVGTTKVCYWFSW